MSPHGASGAGHQLHWGPGKDGGTTTLQNVIAAWDVAATAVEGFSIRCGSYGTPLHHDEGAREPANGAPPRLTSRNVDEYHSKLDSKQCKK